ncbi:MAG: hypothetical protein DKM50_00050 [Candidatus Margulisiibacteriota bacterium]|nr:MAG: hypothetical protein A2X43_03250 [Candidatus Margulisbacteria bacterium GWD2_39_127]PZM84992.1 MAG: hypothetical protein DKM50_00045 [Candidatus Margulisiibacteriota bacterium]OGH99088.1 MAG: hypothetical protein A2X43_03255 [Candidatus Margulisbacteria bacterium GWD2_39_127]PZM84993.1 MAG: hypothetical protein DKM50_00050 [Candidatus Margulisiibacteriota bacterium]HAR63187.1 hypothetical protein [Candidatus Margulisiibacteriota bacterium]
MEYIFGLALIAYSIIYYNYSPAFFGFKNVYERRVYFFIDEMIDLKSFSKVVVYISGYNLPQNNSKVNLFVGKEYLGPRYRGHYAM